MRLVARSAGWLVLVLSLTGCGKPVGQSTGVITWKGAPVAGADVAFQAEASDDAAYGTSAEDGRYYLSYPTNNGLPPGKYRVTVTRYTLKNGQPLPGGEEGAALRGDETRVVRRSYVFEKELAAGANNLDFELTGGKESREAEQ